MTVTYRRLPSGREREIDRPLERSGGTEKKYLKKIRILWLQPFIYLHIIRWPAGAKDFI
jgi:hypothetical protein